MTGVLCERCKARPATTTDLVMKEGRFNWQPLCGQCMAEQTGKRTAIAAGAALAMLAAGIGASFLAQRAQSESQPPGRARMPAAAASGRTPKAFDKPQPRT